jgi:hypothetical protein
MRIGTHPTVTGFLRILRFDFSNLFGLKAAIVEESLTELFPEFFPTRFENTDTRQYHERSSGLHAPSVFNAQSHIFPALHIHIKNVLTIRVHSETSQR